MGRILNMQWDDDLNLVHVVLQATWAAVNQRLAATVEGRERGIGIPPGLYDRLAELTSNLADAIESGKGGDGVPVADPETHPGLLQAFEMAAQGRTNNEIARELNLEGFRTAGSRGGNPFSSASLRWIIPNRFYLRYLSGDTK